jgi:hypothetical protein
MITLAPKAIRIARFVLRSDELVGNHHPVGSPKVTLACPYCTSATWESLNTTFMSLYT